MAHVAFIGLGNMGGPMAGNLLGAGHAVTVFDLVPEACAALAEQGAAVADSAWTDGFRLERRRLARLAREARAETRASSAAI